MDQARERAAWPQGLTLVAQSALPTMGALLLVPVVPLIAAEYGGRPNLDYWIGALLTIPALCIALFSIAAGLLADRVGRRKLLIVALAIYGVAGAAPMFLGGFEAVFASRILLGICEAAIVTLSTAMIGDVFSGQQRDRWLALVGTFASLSAFVFLGLSGVVGQAFGWRGSTGIYALALLIVPAMLLLTSEPRTSRHATETVAAFPWRHMATVSAATLLASSLFYTLLIKQSNALIELGIADPARIGLLSAIASLGNPIATLCFRRLVHIASPILFAAALILLGGGLIGIAWATGGMGFVVAAFVGQFGCGILLPTLLTWTMRPLPYLYRARGTGIFQSLFALGQFVSALLVTALARGFSGSVLGAMQVLGGVAIAVAVTVLLLRNRIGTAAG